MSGLGATAIALVGAFLGAGVGGLIGRGTARGIERRHEERQRERDEKAIRAAALVIFADLAIGQRTLKQAVKSDQWWAFYRMPADAWTRHAPTVAPELSPKEFDTIARAFAHATDITGAVPELLAAQTEKRVLDLAQTGEFRSQVVSLLGHVTDALAILHPVGYGVPAPDPRASH